MEESVRQHFINNHPDDGNPTVEATTIGVVETLLIPVVRVVVPS